MQQPHAFMFPSRPKGGRGATFTDWCLEQGGPIPQPSPPDEGRPTVFVRLHRLSRICSVQTPLGDSSHSRVTAYLATPASKHAHASSCCCSPPSVILLGISSQQHPPRMVACLLRLQKNAQVHLLPRVCLSGSAAQKRCLASRNNPCLSLSLCLRLLRLQRNGRNPPSPPPQCTGLPPFVLHRFRRISKTSSMFVLPISSKSAVLVTASKLPKMKFRHFSRSDCCYIHSDWLAGFKIKRRWGF